MKRRAFLASPLLLCAGPALAAGPAAAAGRAAAVDYAAVRAGRALVFPRDHGSHPAYRTEWWYLTGWLRTKEGAELGMQITFFRNRPGIGEDNPSRFAPSQLLFAHAALSDARVGRLLHDQRAARAGFGLAAAAEADTDLRVEGWTLARNGDAYEARVDARGFGYALAFRPAQPPILQGDRGYSRKGPQPNQASYYYSQPQLEVSGTVTIGGTVAEVSGTAWLDHEWSSEAMGAGAVGWDWAGINLSDGGALMAFRMRDHGGGVYWAGGAHRDAAGRLRRFQPGEIAFTPLRRWRSPRTRAEYPVAVRVQAGALDLRLEPVMEDQELDARASTGTIYWEGAVRAKDGDRIAGRGYLELTGYWKPLKL